MAPPARERILEFVARFPGRDDDEIADALSIHPRQTVNQVCRALANVRLLDRRLGPRGKIANYPVNAPAPRSSHVVDAAVATVVSNSAFDWFWEGNVTSTLVAFLQKNGWTITAVADTLSKQRGPDVVAFRDDQTLIVEVKGFPSKAYRDARRAGERKPTVPANQAQHWYAHAVLKAFRLQHTHPSALVGIALPDFPRYRTLFAETRDALIKVGVVVLFVSENSTVEVVGSTASLCLAR